MNVTPLEGGVKEGKKEKEKEKETKFTFGGWRKRRFLILFSLTWGQSVCFLVSFL